MGCLRGLRWVMENQPWIGVTCVCVITDSDYLAGNYSRAPYWKRDGWRNRADEPIANDDLWDDILKIVTKLAKVGLRVQVQWQKGKKTAMGKIVDKAAKVAAQRGGFNTDFGYRPGSYSRSMVPGGKAAERFTATGQTLVIRPYMKKVRHRREERLSFNIFDEATQTYIGKFFVHVEPSLSLQLHRGNGYRVRFNLEGQFPRITEIVETVQLPKPIRKKKKTI